MLDQGTSEFQRLQLFERRLEEKFRPRDDTQPRERRASDKVSRRDPFRFHRDRSRKDAIGAVARSQQLDVIDPVKQRHNRARGIGCRNRSQRAFQLGRLHGNPEHIHRRDLRGSLDRNAEIAERALKLQLARVLLEGIRANDHRDRHPCFREAGTH